MATLLDEVMNRMLWEAGIKAATAELTIRYHRPTPVGEPLTITAHRVRERHGVMDMEAHAEDDSGRTLVSASNVEKENRNLKKNTEDAAKLGEILGKRMVEKGVDNVVFDRNGYPYHGILKAVADGARKAGVKF